MNQKPIFLAITLATLLAISGAFWLMQKRQVAVNQPVMINPAVDTSVQTETSDKKKEAKEYARNWGGDTSNWKVYMNDELGFAMRYPEEVFDFRILPVSSNDGGLYSAPLPQELELSLTKKGYGIDDTDHQIRIGLNYLKSEKLYYAESSKDASSIRVSINNGKKSGKILGTKSNMKEVKNQYESFLTKGLCGATDPFMVIFDELEHPNGDFISFIHVGCKGEDEDMGRIYKAVYLSVKFFEV